MVVPSLARAGMETVVVSLTRGLAARGHDVGVTCTESKGPLGHTLESLGFRVTLAPAPGLYTIVLPRRLAGWLRRREPDVVHVHSGVWCKGARAARIAGVRRVVFTMHGLDGVRPRYESLLDMWAGRHTTAAVTVSGAFVDYLTDKARIPASRVHVIPNGIDLDRFRPGPRTMRVRRALQIDDDAVLIGHVARFSPVKNHALLVDAFARVAARTPRAFLALVGDGPLRGQIESQVRAAGLTGRVGFVGEVADLHQVYPDFDILVLSSTSEAAPMSVLEAMATGVPIVATAVGGVPALLGQGEAGVLVPPTGAAELAEALCSLVDDAEERRRLGQAARLRTEARYSDTRMVDAYEALYAAEPA